MQVSLTPHGEELLKQQLARGLGRSPEEVVERALEVITRMDSDPTDEARERRRQAVAAMLAFSEKHRLTLGPGVRIGVRIHDLIHEGHKY